METFKVGELKSKFSNILQRVQAGEEIIISFGKKEKKLLFWFRMTNISPIRRVPLEFLKEEQNA